ncbi:MAG: MBL fold metallo-hydrolase [Nitrososphaerota archaeon]|nr:MBL fold metallo-hydrolase [Nitrososphaerota archaeon]
MKLTMLGGAKEIGRSAILLSSENCKLLLDYGISLSREGPDFPLPVISRELDAILLTHAHLDHSGTIPLLYTSAKPKLITTKLTAELSNLLIRDLIKISSYHLPYESFELMKMLQSIQYIGISDNLRIKDLHVETFNAGHIPGSLMFLITTEGKKILYTGDFNTIDTKMLHGAQIKNQNIDVLIMEGTYATVDHGNRTQIESNFINSVNEIINSGGTVVIPAFSVGRAQEIICVLHHGKINTNIYIDGMAKNVNIIFLKYPEYFRDPELLSRAFKQTTHVERWSERKQIYKKPCVIVAPAGMLQGGNVRFYVKNIAKSEKNAIFLVSYQVEETPGATLIKTGLYASGKKAEKVNAKISYFDFSSHCGNTELLNTIKTTKAKKVILIHGEKNYLEKFQKILQEEKIAEEVIIPETGEEIKI